MISSVNNSMFSSKLLDWHYRKSDDFPWRKTSDPYSIWLSEVMLQQTRVSTIFPYYKRWLSALPNIRSVDRAQIDYILKLWEGLGYYNRAHNFHKACKIIIEKYGGIIPNDPLEFSKLPGVGPYICAAVMSIAFNIPLPAVDGNAVRVASRLNSINTPFPKSKTRILDILIGSIETFNPGDFNQAIMDLGRDICTSKSPSCCDCPVNNFCDAYVNNAVDKYPVRVKKSLRPHYNGVVGIIWKNKRILISKRKESGLLGGLWEFPGGRIGPDESGRECIIREAMETLNILVDPGTFIKHINQSYSHFSITLDAYHCKFVGGQPRAVSCADYRWIYPYETHQFAFHRAIHKLFDNIVDSTISV